MYSFYNEIKRVVCLFYSKILITSAEDLNYAVGIFQKKADCPDSVRLRNNQDYSEYTAVSHLTADNVCNKLIAFTDSPGIK